MQNLNKHVRMFIHALMSSFDDVPQVYLMKLHEIKQQNDSGQDKLNQKV